VEIARGLSPVSGGYLMAFKCHSCLSPFVDVLGPILCELGALARNPFQAFPRRPGDPWVSRTDAKGDGEMWDCPRDFFSLHVTLHTSHFTAWRFD
jgi:hypothetical protein